MVWDVDAIGAVEHAPSLNAGVGCSAVFITLLIAFDLVTPDPSSGQGPELRQLLPVARRVHAGELLSSLDLAGRAHTDRPYTIVNFVESADGRAAFDGRSRDLSDPGDREMFHGLREHVDAILVGTGTLRAERYGRLVRDPARRQRRAASGLSPEPLACIFSRGGDIPTDIPLFAEPAARVVVFTPAQIDLTGRRRRGRDRSPRSRRVHADDDDAPAALGLRRPLAPVRGRSDVVRSAARRGPRRRAVPVACAQADRGRHGAGDHERTGARPSCACCRSSGCSSTTARCTCATNCTEPVHLKSVNRFTSTS